MCKSSIENWLADCIMVDSWIMSNGDNIIVKTLLIFHREFFLLVKIKALCSCTLLLLYLVSFSSYSECTSYEKTLFCYSAPSFIWNIFWWMSVQFHSSKSWLLKYNFTIWYGLKKCLSIICLRLEVVWSSVISLWYILKNVRLPSSLGFWFANLLDH